MMNYFISIIEVIVLTYICYTYTNIKPNYFSFRFIISVVLYTVLTCAIYNIDGFTVTIICLKVLVPMISVILLFKVVFMEMSWKLSIIVGFEVAIVYFIWQSLYYGIFTYIMYKAQLNLGDNSNPVMSITGLVLLFIINFVFKDFIKLFIRELSIRTIKLINDRNILVVMDIIYSLLLVAAFLMEALLINSNEPNIYVSLLVFTLSICTILSSVQYMRKVKISNIEFELKQQLIYMDSYKNIVNDVKGFWHSYNNIMQTISLMMTAVDDTSISEVKGAFSQFIDHDRVSCMNNKINLINIPNVAIGGLLSAKIEKACSIDVQLNIKSMGDSAISLNIRDILDTIGILVDNAIECAYYTNDSVVNINIEMHGTFKFEISNEFSIDQYGNTRKYGTSHGIGLAIIKNIVDTNNNTKFTTNIVGTKYTSIFEVKNNV